MAKLFGAQRLVLQAIQDSPKDAAGFVTDVQIVRSTNLVLRHLRYWIETLEDEVYVDVARTEAGLSVSITAREGKWDVTDIDCSHGKIASLTGT
jgi:hypothetical protein